MRKPLTLREGFCWANESSNWAGILAWPDKYTVAAQIKHKNFGFLGTVEGKKNVFLHPCRGSKLEGPPFEGPGTSVQGPRGVGGAPHLIDIKRMGGWVGGWGEVLVPLTSVMACFHTASTRRQPTTFLI